jgi:predicted HTH domain antitoxin
MSMNHHKKWEVQLPDEMVRNLEFEGYDQEVVQLSLAMFLFVEKKVSLERAAELSGLSLLGFMEVLKRNRIPWGEYTKEHYEQDKEFMDSWFEENGHPNEKNRL